MKKIIALVLAIVMMAAMSVVVFADEEPRTTAEEVNVGADGVFNGEDHKVKVTYTTSKGYAVTIPADITIDTVGVETTFALTKANLEGGETLTVTIDGENDPIMNGEEVTSKWKLVDKSATPADPVGYKIDVTGTVNAAEDIAQGAAILTYASNAEAFTTIVATLKLTANATNQVADFVDYLTFSVAIN